MVSNQHGEVRTLCLLRELDIPKDTPAWFRVEEENHSRALPEAGSCSEPRVGGAGQRQPANLTKKFGLCRVIVSLPTFRFPHLRTVSSQTVSFSSQPAGPVGFLFHLPVCNTHLAFPSCLCAFLFALPCLREEEEEEEEEEQPVTEPNSEEEREDDAPCQGKDRYRAWTLPGSH